MAGGAHTGNDELLAGINVTPFVDIALVLLIIFMVTAKYIVQQPQIPMDLPRAATGQRQISHTVQVAINAAQSLFVDGTPKNEAELRQMIEQQAAREPDLRVVIAADGSVPHRRVVQVIDIIRAAHVTKFAIQTQMPDLPAEATRQ